jgi:threonine/homoserine/homoserine lactone efflux protein
MTYAQHLWLFFVLVFGAVILPGMDMAFILGSALTGGRTHGLSAVAGAMAGAACHSVVVVFGVGMLLRLWPGAFDIVLIAGTCYIAWIGASILRGAARMKVERPVAEQPPTPVSNWQTFRRALANNMMNPSAYLFSLAVFPQFIFADAGPIALQAFLLFAIIALTQAGVYGSLVLAAARVRAGLIRKPRAEIMLKSAVGMMLIGVAILTGIESWRRL